MDLLEYEGKRLFADAGLPVLPARVADTAAEASVAARCGWSRAMPRRLPSRRSTAY